MKLNFRDRSLPTCVSIVVSIVLYSQFRGRIEILISVEITCLVILRHSLILLFIKVVCNINNIKTAPATYGISTL